MHFAHAEVIVELLFLKPMLCLAVLLTDASQPGTCQLLPVGALVELPQVGALIMILLLFDCLVVTPLHLLLLKMGVGIVELLFKYFILMALLTHLGLSLAVFLYYLLLIGVPHVGALF